MKDQDSQEGSDVKLTCASVASGVPGAARKVARLLPLGQEPLIFDSLHETE